MRRREFLGVLGSTAMAWPLVVRAQQGGDVRRVAVLMGTAKSQTWIAATASLIRRLGELGWLQGDNLITDVQWNQPGLMQTRAAELIARSPDVVVVFTNFALGTLKPIARNVPIVFVGVGDPVGSGFVASLAQPGGNLTGFASHDVSLGSKWLDVLKEAAPHITRALVIMPKRKSPIHERMLQSVEKAGRQLEIEVTAGKVSNITEIERAIASFAQKPNGGLVVLPSALSAAFSPSIIAPAQRYRMPQVFASLAHAAEGALISYGLDWNDQFRRVAEYVDRILRGTSPSALPVQKPTRFKLVINLKTAKAIGLTIPQSFLLRADEVIE
jgi:putative ABC transport system substrate-binding protein